MKTLDVCISKTSACRTSARSVTGLFAVLFSAVLLGGVSAQADISTGLVGYWPLLSGPGSSTVIDGAGSDIGTLTNFADATYNNMWTTITDPTNADPYAIIFNTNGSAGSPTFGTNTYINIPNSASLDQPTSNTKWTMSAWVYCSVAPASEPANAGIIAKGNQNAEAYALYMSGGNFTTTYHNATNNGTETVSTTNTLVANTWYNVTVTIQEPKLVSAPEALIYVNGALVSATNGNTYTTTYSTSLPVTIGCRAGTVANGGVVNNAFEGIIDQVRIYNRALTASDVLQLYEASESPPYITTQPVSGTANENSAFTNTVAAYGSGTLYYQWYTNNVPIDGATSTNLIINPVLPVWNGINYYAVVTNNYGATTSAVVHLTVQTTLPTFINQSPVTYTNLSNTNIFTLYAGVSPTFSVSTLSATPISYYWYTNGVAVGGVNVSNFTWMSVQTNSINSYCIASNSAGMATSAVWSASVIADPTNSTGGLAPYPQSVLALNPIGYWRLNEPDDNGGNTGGDGNPNAVCFDYAGGNDGLYTNVNLSQPGYNPTADPSDTSALFGENGPPADSYAGQVQGIDFSSPNGTNKAFTIEAWTEGYNSQTYDAGIVSKGYGGGGEQFVLDTGSDGGTPSHAFRFLFRDASGAVHMVNSSIATSPYSSVWYHLAGVVDEANSNMVFYINGVPVGTTVISPKIGVLASTYAMSIGSRMQSAITDFNYQYYGYINDVAVFNYALSSNQVANEYASAGNTPPFFTQPPPTNETVVAGTTLTIPVTAYGTPTLNYTWYDPNNNVLASGSANGTSLNAPFTTNSVPAAWNGGQLKLTVNNTYGTTNVYVALSILTAPVITNNLPPQITIGQGQSYTYTVGAIGATPLRYQWYNGGSVIATQTNTAYTLTGSSAGTFTYSVIVTNFLGSVTSVVSTLTILPTPTNSYSTNILNLNPVGYWPMHEVETPAPGDIETNYGSLGLLGTGYYVDWVGLQGINHGFSGALIHDPDTAVYFPWSGGGNAGGTTNCLVIPQTSPLATLNPPFTVECWFWPTNTGSGDVWGQSGYEGLNAGAAGGGGGTVCGIRVYWNASKFTVYTYTNNTSGLNTVGVSASGTVGQWNHLVVTCDANTNIAEYLNGALQFTNAAVGVYSPDYWSPMTLATSRGFTRNISGGIDEFAVYPTNLSADDISTHFNDRNSGAGVYLSDVTNDNPVIYLRMDSPVYTPPLASLLPVLVNYGSAGVNGVYTPGTMPGIVPGPAQTNGVPFSGLTGTNVAQLSGVSSFADAGYAAVYNPTGAVPFSVSAMFRGNPADGRNQSIVGHGTNSWQLWMNTSGKLVWQLGTNTSSLTSSGVYNDGHWHQVVAVYAPSINPATAGIGSIYVDGSLNASTVAVSTNGIGPGSPLDVMIGSDPQYTNNPAGLGQQFAGQVCEVALFTNALTAGQVKNLYNITASFPGLNASLGPSNLTLYAGQTFTYNVQASGTLPFYYQWSQGASPIPNATNASYAAVAVLGVTNTYSCMVSNAYNGYSVTNVGPVALTGIAPPTNLYSATVLSNNPIAYWRLDETSGTLARDYVGGHGGTYTNVQQGVPGYNPSVDPDLAAIFGTNTLTMTAYSSNSLVLENDRSANGVANIDFSQPAGSNAEFSVEAWVNGGASQISGAGIITKGYGNGGEQFDLDVVSGGYPRFFVRDASGSVYSALSATFILDGNWHHVVGVCDEAGGNVSLYVDGAAVTNAPVTPESGLLSTSAGVTVVPNAYLVSIGARTQSKSAVSYNFQYIGTLDEVALYNYALSSTQVAADYQAGIASGINANPTNIVFSVAGGTNLVLSWPQDHTGWTLQAQTNSLTVGISTNWVDVCGSTATNQVVIPINLTNGSVFYRLVYPAQ